MTTFKEACSRAGLSPKAVIHVGAGMLEEAEMYRDMGVSEVLWIEAQPSRPERRARAKQFGHHLIEGLAIGGTERLAILNIASNYASSSILPLKRHAQLYPDIVYTDQVIVPVMTLDKVVASLGDHQRAWDALVIDAQGFEGDILIGATGTLSQIKVAFLEVSPTELYAGQAIKPNIDLHMHDKGFTHTEYYEEHIGEWGDSLYWK